MMYHQDHLLPPKPSRTSTDNLHQLIKSKSGLPPSTFTQDQMSLKRNLSNFSLNSQNSESRRISEGSYHVPTPGKNITSKLPQPRAIRLMPSSVIDLDNSHHSTKSQSDLAQTQYTKYSKRNTDSMADLRKKWKLRSNKENYNSSNSSNFATIDHDISPMLKSDENAQSREILEYRPGENQTSNVKEKKMQMQSFLQMDRNRQRTPLNFKTTHSSIHTPSQSAFNGFSGYSQKINTSGVSSIFKDSQLRRASGTNLNQKYPDKKVFHKKRVPRNFQTRNSVFQSYEKQTFKSEREQTQTISDIPSLTKLSGFDTMKSATTKNVINSARYTTQDHTERAGQISSFEFSGGQLNKSVEAGVNRDSSGYATRPPQKLSINRSEVMTQGLGSCERDLYSRTAAYENQLQDIDVGPVQTTEPEMQSPGDEGRPSLSPCRPASRVSGRRSLSRNMSQVQNMESTTDLGSVPYETNYDPSATYDAVDHQPSRIIQRKSTQKKLNLPNFLQEGTDYKMNVAELNGKESEQENWTWQEQDLNFETYTNTADPPITGTPMSALHMETSEEKPTQMAATHSMANLKIAEFCSSRNESFPALPTGEASGSKQSYKRTSIMKDCMNRLKMAPSHGQLARPPPSLIPNDNNKSEQDKSFQSYIPPNRPVSQMANSAKKNCAFGIRSGSMPAHKQRQNTSQSIFSTYQNARSGNNFNPLKQLKSILKQNSQSYLSNTSQVSQKEEPQVLNRKLDFMKSMNFDTVVDMASPISKHSKNQNTFHELDDLSFTDINLNHSHPREYRLMKALTKILIYKPFLQTLMENQIQLDWFYSRKPSEPADQTRTKFFIDTLERVMCKKSYNTGFEGIYSHAMEKYQVDMERPSEQDEIYEVCQTFSEEDPVGKQSLESNQVKVSIIESSRNLEYEVNDQLTVEEQDSLSFGQISTQKDETKRQLSTPKKEIEMVQHDSQELRAEMKRQTALTLIVKGYQAFHDSFKHWKQVNTAQSCHLKMKGQRLHQVVIQSHERKLMMRRWSAWKLLSQVPQMPTIQMLDQIPGVTSDMCEKLNQQVIQDAQRQMVEVESIAQQVKTQAEVIERIKSERRQAQIRSLLLKKVKFTLMQAFKMWSVDKSPPQFLRNMGLSSIKCSPLETQLSARHKAPIPTGLNNSNHSRVLLTSAKNKRGRHQDVKPGVLNYNQDIDMPPLPTRPNRATESSGSRSRMGSDETRPLRIKSPSSEISNQSSYGFPNNIQNVYLGNILLHHFVTKPLWEGMERLKEISKEGDNYEYELGEGEEDYNEELLKAPYIEHRHKQHFSEEIREEADFYEIEPETATEAIQPQHRRHDRVLTENDSENDFIGFEQKRFSFKKINSSRVSSNSRYVNGGQ